MTCQLPRRCLLGFAAEGRVYISVPRQLQPDAMRVQLNHTRKKARWMEGFLFFFRLICFVNVVRCSVVYISCGSLSLVIVFCALKTEVFFFCFFFPSSLSRCDPSRIPGERSRDLASGRREGRLPAAVRRATQMTVCRSGLRICCPD